MKNKIHRYQTTLCPNFLKHPNDMRTIQTKGYIRVHKDPQKPLLFLGDEVLGC